MYFYPVKSGADEVAFQSACIAVEKEIGNDKKVRTSEDVDGSLACVYNVDGKKVSVFNSYVSDSVYIRSDIPLGL